MPPADDQYPPLNDRKIVKVLAKHGVEYIVVGGVGTRFHGATCETQDCDVVIKIANDNIKRLIAALDELDGRIRAENMSDYEARQFSRNKEELLIGNDVTPWRTSAGDMDILAFIPDQYGDPRYYAGLKQNADRQTAESVQIWVAGLDDIIASKRYANHPKDLKVLPELYRLQSQVTKHPEKKRIRPSRAPDVSYELDNSPGHDL